jgi:hypothetical protein
VAAQDIGAETRRMHKMQKYFQAAIFHLAPEKTLSKSARRCMAATLEVR